MLQTDATFDAVFSRVRKATGLNKQKELACLLDVRQATISEAKKRGSFPSDWIVKLSVMRGVNSAWLATGKGPMLIEPEAGREPPSQLADEGGPAYEIDRNGQRKKQGEVVVPDFLSSKDTQVTGAMHPDADKLSAEMEKGKEMLGKIYRSDSKTLIRAINSNLEAFCEAIDNRQLAEKAISDAEESRRMYLELKNEMDSRIGKMELEQAALRKRFDEASGG